MKLNLSTRWNYHGSGVNFYTFPNLVVVAWVKNLNLNEVANINCLYYLTIRITMNWWNRSVIDSYTSPYQEET